MKTLLHTVLTSTCLASFGFLAACNQGASNGNQPMAAASLPALPAAEPMQSGAPTALVAAPPAAALPRAPRPVVRRLSNQDGGYAYLDRAASYDDVIGDAPPDYAFDYGGVSPWGWQAGDGSIAYAEPISDGYRYYYYEPGRDTPYLVRDPDYSYAYDGEALVGIYDHGGRALAPSGYGQREDYAGRYIARAQALRAAAQSGRRGVVAANWAARRSQVAAENARWNAARAQDAQWAAYHARVGSQEQAHWQDEQAARRQAARHFDDYQRSGFRGPPPDFARRQDQHRQVVDQRQQAQADQMQVAQRQQQAEHQQHLQQQIVAQRQLQAEHQQHLAVQHQQQVQQQPMTAQRQLQAEHQQHLAEQRQQQAQQQRMTAQRQLQAQHQQHLAEQRQQQLQQQRMTAQRQLQAQHQQHLAEQRQQQVQQQRMTAQRQLQAQHQQHLAEQRQQQLQQQRMTAQRQLQAQHQQHIAAQREQAAAQHQEHGNGEHRREHP